MKLDAPRANGDRCPVSFISRHSEDASGIRGGLAERVTVDGRFPADPPTLCAELGRLLSDGIQTLLVLEISSPVHLAIFVVIVVCFCFFFFEVVWLSFSL